ncbi:MAG: alpha/beta hydrolase [Nitriliruptorales bacterium]|nr:alpha/beta hydrolase [Nitriliruptorales bacterium]
MPVRELDGIDVGYREQGEGEPVLFLHSGPGSAADWKQVFQRFPSGHRLVALHAYGRGGTADWPSGELQVEDIAKLARRLITMAGPPVHLVGHSYGGAVALRLAVTDPDSVRTLAVLEPQAYPLLRESDPELYEETRTVAEQFRSALSERRLEDAWRGFIDHYGASGSWDQLPAQAQAGMLAMSDAALRSWNALFTHPIEPADLEDLRMPVLAIEGGRSTGPERRMCEIVAERAPHGRLVVIEEAGHMLPLTHPAEVVDALIEHIS